MITLYLTIAAVSFTWALILLKHAENLQKYDYDYNRKYYRDDV